VFAPDDADYFVKLLYGSSFKAPSPDQLYQEPATIGDTNGTRAFTADSGTDVPLTYQTAQSLELAGGVRIGESAHVQANVFATKVGGRIEYQEVGMLTFAFNQLEEWVVGGEAEARVEPIERGQIWAGVGVARSVHQTDEEDIGVRVRIQPTQPLFPVLQAHTRLSYKIPVVDVTLAPELSFVSEREASRANVVRRAEVYALPAYFRLDVAASAGWRIIGGRATDVSLRFSNLTNANNAEPGFGGIDLSALGRSVYVNLRQEL
jgi:iron complex outermembrane receptor protein